jgi:hypothetical protein
MCLALVNILKTINGRKKLAGQSGEHANHGYWYLMENNSLGCFYNAKLFAFYLK